MPNKPDKIEVRATPEFKRSLRTLEKRYRHIRSDVQPIIGELQAVKVLGDQISGIHHTVFKVRIKNSDVQRGKSGGYRFIYFLKTPNKIILVTIYSKSDQGDIAADKIKEIIARFDF